MENPTLNDIPVKIIDLPQININRFGINSITNLKIEAKFYDFNFEAPKSTMTLYDNLTRCTLYGAWCIAMCTQNRENTHFEFAIDQMIIEKLYCMTDLI